MSRLERILAGALPEGAEIVSERILRRVFCCTLDDGREVFAKQHLFPALRVRLRYALRASPTRREAGRLAAAAERGLRVPAVVAERSQRGLLGPRLAVLVTEALPACGAASHAERLAATEQLAELGIEHPDLHPDNVLRLEGGGLGFLDFQSVRMHAGRVSGAPLVRMRAKAAGAALAELGLAELRSLLSAQLGRAEVEATLAALERLRAGELASRRRHALRTSSRFVRERLGIWSWRVRLRGEELSAEPNAGCRSTRGHEPGEQDLGGGVRARICSPELLRLSSRTGQLRELWLRAALGDAPKDATFLAYGRDGAWPWTREHLYIRPGRLLGGDADVLACWDSLARASGGSSIC